jgi:hypothetical protein
MYANLTNSTQFIRELLKIRKRTAKDLAYECFKCLKVSNRRIEPTLEQAIKTLASTVQSSLYQQLETYLKNSQWCEADEETNHLMLQIVGKETDQWLTEQDITNFPCEDLRTIDDLWVDYSNEKFGFSEQKKVWIACGGVPGEYDWDIFERFAVRVGWLRSGYWLGMDKLTYSLENSKHAHLPRVIGCRQGQGRGFWMLFSRAATCNL